MIKVFKNLSYLVIAGLLTAAVYGCVKKPDKSQVVAEINNFSLTVDDFKNELSLSLSGATKEQVLQDAIIKELLLQEAQKNSLNMNRRFMKEIENYWKQALIKRLIFIKGEEFLASVKVGDDEARAQYDFIARENDGKVKPYEQMSGPIKDELRIRKAQALLEQWVSKLKANARIKKYDQVLDSIQVEKAIDQDGGINEQ